MIKEVTNKQKETNKIGFPKFMKGVISGDVVLILSKNDGERYYGVVVVSKDPDRVGCCDNWNLSIFTDYNEPITLQNITE